ncbi:hypothetical protein CALCODRAFT_507333 [Calocera cornea HHB12733]|uniref:Uncharacterized protein n=1 Tax=Calocera cornea HHB12733 TaxID=1353952 RepID=A0A165HVM9_9BASI|nr:hypothetical protein CALCODRAFT_507333 [Calocera cornea HHB12733]
MTQQTEPFKKRRRIEVGDDAMEGDVSVTMSPSSSVYQPVVGFPASSHSNTSLPNHVVPSAVELTESEPQSRHLQETSQNFDYLFHNNPLRLRKLFEELTAQNAALKMMIHEIKRDNGALSGRQQALVSALGEQRALRKEAQEKAELIELQLKYFSIAALK